MFQVFHKSKIRNALRQSTTTILPRNEGSQEPPHDADGRTSQCHEKEGGYGGEVVLHDESILTNVTEALEHVIQNLQK